MVVVDKNQLFGSLVGWSRLFVVFFVVCELFGCIVCLFVGAFVCLAVVNRIIYGSAVAWYMLLLFWFGCLLFVGCSVDCLFVVRFVRLCAVR